jgi:DNA-3-methyladenine glycosylase I
MRAYHDEEWGVPLYDSQALWGKLMLDGFQAGLSWSIILKRRPGFLRAFEGFDPEIIAQFGEAEVARLLEDPGIVRSRAKINATISNARAYLAMRDRGEDFAEFCWEFVDGVPIRQEGNTIPPQTDLSSTVSKQLKRRGFTFVGPVIVYAWMQGVGLVNDHTPDCFRRDIVSSIRN